MNESEAFYLKEGSNIMKKESQLWLSFLFLKKIGFIVTVAYFFSNKFNLNNLLQNIVVESKVEFPMKQYFFLLGLFQAYHLKLTVKFLLEFLNEK